MIHLVLLSTTTFNWFDGVNARAKIDQNKALPVAMASPATPTK